MQCVATHTVLRRMYVSGAAGAVDRLREAVLLTEQWHQFPGTLQHPAPGKQPDPVRILYSKRKKKIYTQLSKSVDTILSSTGLVCCPSACQMCGNPNCPPECPHICRWVSPLVSSVVPVMCWQNATYLPFHCQFDFTLMLSIAFPAVLSLKTPGKFICVFVSAVCLFVGVWPLWQEYIMIVQCGGLKLKKKPKTLIFICCVLTNLLFSLWRLLLKLSENLRIFCKYDPKHLYVKLTKLNYLLDINCEHCESGTMFMSKCKNYVFQ